MPLNVPYDAASGEPLDDPVSQVVPEPDPPPDQVGAFPFPLNRGLKVEERQNKMNLRFVCFLEYKSWCW